MGEGKRGLPFGTSLDLMVLSQANRLGRDLSLRQALSASNFLCRISILERVRNLEYDSWLESYAFGNASYAMKLGDNSIPDPPTFHS